MKYGKPGILVWARERFQYFRFFFFEDCSNRWSHPTLEAGSSKKKTDSLPHECRSQYLVKRVNIWYHSDPHYQWKRFTWPVFFFAALGCLLERNSYRPTLTGLHSMCSTIFRLFPSGGEKNNCAAYCTIPLDVLQGMPAEIFAQKIEDLTCMCSTLCRI